MMMSQMADKGEGLRAARRFRGRQWRAAAFAMAGGLAVVAILARGGAGPGHIKPAYAIASVVAMAFVVPLAVILTSRTKDELHRQNALRANSFGLYACMLGGWSWLVLNAGGIAPPPNVLVIYLATGVVTLGRYTMLKWGSSPHTSFAAHLEDVSHARHLPPSLHDRLAFREHDARSLASCCSTPAFIQRC